MHKCAFDHSAFEKSLEVRKNIQRGSKTCLYCDERWFTFICNGLIAYRIFGAPTASTRISRHSSGSLSHPRRSIIDYCLIALPNQHEVTDRRASACGQATQLTVLSYLAHALCADILFHEQGVVGHRAILIFLGIGDVAGGFK